MLDLPIRKDNNIDWSKERVKKIKSRILRTFESFSSYYTFHCSPATALRIYFEVENGQTAMPGINNFYKSYSTMAPLIPNMKAKTQLLNVLIADHYINHDFTKSMIDSFKECGKHVKSIVGKNLITKRKTHHAIDTFFCDFKFCPIRQHLEAQKRNQKISTQLKYLYEKKHWVPLFLTLTVKDIKKPTAYKVKTVTKRINKAVKRMMKYKKYNGDNRFNKANKGIVKGWISKPEITYKRKENMLHPHAHVILMVRKSYLNKYGSKYYLEKQTFKDDWQRAYGIGYDPIMSIEVPYYKDNTGNKIKITECLSKTEKLKCLRHASVEIAKYTAKSADFSKMPRLKGKIDKKKINKWSLKTRQVSLEKAGRHSKNELIREYLIGHLAKEKLNLVNAFHAICKGLKNTKTLHFGGWCQWSNLLYNAGALKRYENKPAKADIVYKYEVSSKFIFKDMDYLDTYQNFSKKEIKRLTKQGFQIDPIDVKTGRPLYQKPEKKPKPYWKLMKSIPNALVNQWYKTKNALKIKYWNYIEYRASLEVFGEQR